jgi:poly(hydroxyalkanoate) granule-associated protein
MTTTTRSSSQNTIQERVTRRGRDVWLASLGALATVENESTKAFQSLVERGKSLESAGRKQLTTTVEQAAEQGDQALQSVGSAGEDTRDLVLRTVDRALDRIGIASRSEVNRLADQIGELSQKVDELTHTLQDADKS